MDIIKSKSKSKSVKNIKSKSKSLTKSKTKSIKNKSKSKSYSKSSYSKIDTFILKIKREHNELDNIYKMRLEFIQSLLNKNKIEKKVSNIPYLNSMSFIHIYKNIYGNKYIDSIEKEYNELVN